MIKICTKKVQAWRTWHISWALGKQDQFIKINIRLWWLRSWKSVPKKFRPEEGYSRRCLRASNALQRPLPPQSCLVGHPVGICVEKKIWKNTWKCVVLPTLSQPVYIPATQSDFCVQKCCFKTILRKTEIFRRRGAPKIEECNFFCYGNLYRKALTRVCLVINWQYR